MPVYLMAKPGLAEAAISTSGASQYLGGAGADFYMKLMTADFNFYSPSADVTGDGDPQAKWENNMILQGDITLRGGMIAQRKVGLANLIKWSSNRVETVDNPLGTSTGRIAHIFLLGGSKASGSPATSGEWLRLKLHLTGIQYSFGRSLPFTPVAIRAKVSNMTTTDIDAIERYKSA